ncbi:hypothetical protein LSO9J_120006 [Candidatus Liberibacter solanacearum]
MIVRFQASWKLLSKKNYGKFKNILSSHSYENMRQGIEGKARYP